VADRALLAVVGITDPTQWPHAASEWITSVVVTLLSILSAHPLRWAVVAMAVLFWLYYVVASKTKPKRVNPLWAAVGADGRLSTSKFQFLVWTIPVLYVALALVFARSGTFTPELPAGRDVTKYITIPPNIFIVLGLSLTTLLGAKGITVAYQARKAPATTVTPAPDTLQLGYLIQDDNGDIDLTKVQMLAWTAVAVIAFLFAFISNAGGYVHCQVKGPDNTGLCFPDVDTALMVLMGLGQGTYLGGKLISRTEPPSVESLIVTAAGPFVGVQLTGSNLDGGSLRLTKGSDSVELPMTWSSATAVGRVPLPFGTVNASSPPGQTGTVSPQDPVIISGTINGVAFGPQTVMATPPYTVTAVAAALSPVAPAKSTEIVVTLTGTNLLGGVLTIEDVPAKIRWGGTTAVATVPNPIGARTITTGTPLIVKGTIGAIDYNPVTVTVA
jgi:hypothetical protein